VRAAPAEGPAAREARAAAEARIERIDAHLHQAHHQRNNMHRQWHAAQEEMGRLRAAHLQAQAEAERLTTQLNNQTAALESAQSAQSALDRLRGRGLAGAERDECHRLRVELLAYADQALMQIWTIQRKEEEEKKKALESESDLCVICLSAARNCALVPCGHSQVCVDCANRIDHCPICRKRVASRVKLYL